MTFGMVMPKFVIVTSEVDGYLLLAKRFDFLRRNPLMDHIEVLVLPLANAHALLSELAQVGLSQIAYIDATLWVADREVTEGLHR